MTRSAVFVTAALLLFGCSTPPPVSRPEPLDQAVPVATEDPGVVALAHALEEAVRTRQALVGVARMSLQAPDLRFSQSQRIALMRPASLRVEILGLFDQVAAVLAIDGLRYQLYEAGSSELQEGDLGRGLLWQVARIDLEPEEVVGLLLGAPVQSVSSLESARELDDGSVLLGFRHLASGTRRIFEFDASSRLVRVRQRAPDDVLVWEAAYTEYGALGEPAFAREVEIEFPEQNARASFHFRQVGFKPELPASLFVLETPSR